MRFSLSRLLQWGGIAVVLLAVVGLNYDFNSEARVQMNASVEDSLSQGMRGYWKMDTGSGTSAVDASGNANNLSFTGSPSWVTGNIGPSALDFSGSGQYLSVADPSSGVLDMADGASFTLTGWFNRDTFTADHTIVAKKNSQSTNTDDGYIVWVDDADDLIHFRADENGSTDSYTMASSTAFTATGWHHFAISWNDSVGMNIYVDGANNNGTASGTFANVGTLANSVAFAIGAESDGGNPFDGKLDDIRVYGNALSAEEVKKLYQTTAPAEPVDTSLVGHWTFDGMDVDSVNGIVRDRSMSGNNGTFTPAYVTPTIGKLGQAIHSDGTAWESIELNSVTNLEMGTGDMTIALWMNLTTVNGDVWSFVKKIGAESSEGYLTDYYPSLDTLSVLVGTGSLYTYYGVDTPFPLVGSGWHHLTYVIDRDAGVSFYLDGVFLGKDGSSVYNGTDITNVSQAAYIAYTDANAEVVSYDDVRVYNRALSATEVVSLYNIGK